MLQHYPPFKVIFIAAVLQLVVPLSAHAEGLFLRNLHVLDDEYRGYCLDIPGARGRINRDNPVGMRACKYLDNNVDQQFVWVAPDGLYASEYELCVAVDKIDNGGKLMMQDCADVEVQSWAMSPDGLISPSSRPDLCLTFSAERGISNSPAWLASVYHSRTVGLAPCSQDSMALQQFRWGALDEQGIRTANQVGADMPDDLAAAIRRVSEQGVAASQTGALYRDQPRVYDIAEIEVDKNLSYGPHERNVLDVHTDKYRNGDGRPVIMYFHGGGFVRGNKDGNRNVADYFASLGLVGVNGTYRLAPEAKWPDGANDIAAAVTWVKENISEYGGDPNQIYVVGKSAAAAHVATYAFRPDVLEPGTATAAGVIMVSGSYGAETGSASEGRISYFGDDFSRWPGISTTGNVDRTNIPALFTVSEFGNPGTEESLVELMSELTDKTGQMPRVVQLIGHNHYSPNPSVGTQDTQLSAAILEFVMSTAESTQMQTAR